MGDKDFVLAADGWVQLTPCGEYLAQKGLATEAETEGLVGAGVVVATGIWSIWAKRKALAKVPPKAVGCILLCALMLGASGCLTRTRCQALAFNDCSFRVNEPVGVDDPKYPRSLQIGVNDQQIEGGTDTIASGNKTDPSLSVPMGDSTLSAISQFFGGLAKGGTSTAKGSAAAPVAADAGGTACADGSCSAK
jgi:hypothetical protein